MKKKTTVTCDTNINFVCVRLKTIGIHCDEKNLKSYQKYFARKAVFFVILNKNSEHLYIKLNANETIIQFVRFYQADGERVI